MNSRFCVIISIFTICASMMASTVVTPESVALSHLSTAIGLYAELHNGELIKNWQRVRGVFNLDDANNTLHKAASAGFPLEDHYEFIAETVSYPGYEGSQILLARTVPLQRAKGKPKFRYIVTRSKDGTTASLHVPEEEVQAMFQKAGVPLPTPKPGLPAVEIEAVPSAEEIYAQVTPAVTVNQLPSSKTNATPAQAAPLLSTPVPIASPSPAAKSEAKQLPSSSLIVPLVVLAVAIIGIVVFLLKRRGGMKE